MIRKGFSFLFKIVATLVIIVSSYIAISAIYFNYKFHDLDKLFYDMQVLNMKSLYTIDKITQIYQRNPDASNLYEYQMNINNMQNELMIIKFINDDHKVLNDKILMACNKIDFSTYKSNIVTLKKYDEYIKYCEELDNKK